MKRFAFIAFATVLSFTPAIAADNWQAHPRLMRARILQLVLNSRARHRRAPAQKLI